MVNVDEIVDSMCGNILEIKKMKKLGKGVEGSVYEWCVSTNDCNYVIKIQKYNEKPSKTYTRLKNDQELFKKIGHVVNVPHIYKILDCKKEKVFLILMDKIEGQTLEKRLSKVPLSSEEFNKLLDDVVQLHTFVPNGHGDLYLGNIMYDGDVFTFIDFNINKKKKAYQDFLRLSGTFDRVFNKLSKVIGAKKSALTLLSYLNSIVKVLKQNYDSVDIQDYCDIVEYINLSTTPSDHEYHKKRFHTKLSDLADYCLPGDEYCKMPNNTLQTYLTQLNKLHQEFNYTLEKDLVGEQYAYLSTIKELFGNHVKDYTKFETITNFKIALGDDTTLMFFKGIMDKFENEPLLAAIEINVLLIFSNKLRGVFSTSEPHKCYKRFSDEIIKTI